MSIKRGLSPTSCMSKVAKISSLPAADEITSTKDALRNVISLYKTNAGDFSYGSLLSHSEIPAQPLIDIMNYGILPLPINSHVYKELNQIFEDSPYGLGEKTVLDKTIRNSIQLDQSKFTITNKDFSTKLNEVLQSKVKQAFGLSNSNIYADPYKLLVYNKGGKFALGRFQKILFLTYFSLL